METDDRQTGCEVQISDFRRICLQRPLKKFLESSDQGQTTSPKIKNQGRESLRAETPLSNKTFFEILKYRDEHTFFDGEMAEVVSYDNLHPEIKIRTTEVERSASTPYSIILIPILWYPLRSAPLSLPLKHRIIPGGCSFFTCEHGPPQPQAE